MTHHDLFGKTIMVTGASRGIGSAIASHLASLGAQVAITYTSKPDLAMQVSAGLPGSGHLVVPLDLNDESSIQGAFDATLEKFGRLDGLVNNAGLTHDQLLLRMKAEDFDKVVQSNLRGTFLCTRIASKIMIKARQGSIVHVTSVIGQTGNAGQANYAASKAGIEALSKSVALELASRNIRSNCVAPGFIESDMTHALNDAQRKSILDRVPLGKIGTGKDVALAVAFLLSDDSQYITGQTINVNGGLYMG